MLVAGLKLCVGRGAALGWVVAGLRSMRSTSWWPTSDMQGLGQVPAHPALRNCCSFHPDVRQG